VDLDDKYQASLRHAVEYAYVVAARRGLDTSQLIVAMDPDHNSEARWEHTLSISLRNSELSVRGDGIPHDWIEIGTGFIDPRFSHRVTTLLTELEKMWVKL